MSADLQAQQAQQAALLQQAALAQNLGQMSVQWAGQGRFGGAIATVPSAGLGGLPGLPGLPAALHAQSMAIRQSIAGTLAGQPAAAAASALDGGAASSASAPSRRSPERKSAEDPSPDGQKAAGERQEEEEDLKDVPKCPLHKKPNGKCKFCQRHEAFLERKRRREEAAREADGGRPGKGGAAADRPSDRSGPLEFANKKTYGLPPLLQTHIIESTHFRTLLNLDSFEGVVNECYEFANSVEPYLPNSGTSPSGLFVCLYRFFTLGIEGRDLARLLENRDSPFIRCAGFLYVRYGLSSDKLWGWLEEYILDDAEFRPSPEQHGTLTIGEYIEGLLTSDKYYGAVLPRIPVATQRVLMEKLAPVEQHRRRTQQNKEALDLFRESSPRVEVNLNGEWVRGKIHKLHESNATRIKVRIKLEDGGETTAALGKVILLDRAQGGDGRRRSRSPHRGSERDENLSYSRGRPDAELIAEMRDRDRNKAVVGTGRSYAPRVLSFEGACALPGDHGNAVRKLISDEGGETSARRRPRANDQQQAERSGPSREQSEEHRRRMQAVFEKYGTTKASASQSKGGGGPDLLGPDTLRLG